MTGGVVFIGGDGRRLALDGLKAHLRWTDFVSDWPAPWEYPTLPEHERQPGAKSRAEAKRERRRAKRSGAAVNAAYREKR